MQDVRLWAWICLDLMTVLIALFVIRHYARKGFIQTLYSALKWILSLLLIRWLFAPATEWLKSQGLETYFTGVIEGWFTSAGGLGTDEFIEGLPLPKAIIEYLKANNNASAYAQMGVTNAISFVARTLADIAVNIIAIVGLILIFQILFLLVGKILGFLSQLPLLHSINSVLGSLIGVVMAVIFLWLISTGLYISAALGNWPILSRAMDDTRVLSWINQWNFLLHYAYTLKLR